MVLTSRVGKAVSGSMFEAFLGDTQEGAYERVVDRLMETTAYAERRAQDWLDLARYADTRGFADDKMRQIWPYRDWVIRALDRNMPFDQFTVEQRLATGFHRNAPASVRHRPPPFVGQRPRP